MVTWGATGTGPSAIGAPGPYEIRSTDWEQASPCGVPTGEPGTVRPADITGGIRGTASDLVVPARKGHIVALDRDTSYHLTAEVTLPAASYLLRCGPPGRRHSGNPAPPWVELRFDGPATLVPGDGTIEVDLPCRRSVELTFPEPANRRDPITVPETPAGLATALSHSGAGIPTTGPERALPGNRPRPPAIESGRRTTVPTDVRHSATDTGIELHLPASFEALFVGAPLAYYLGADVTAGEVRTPRLAVPGTGVEREFAGGKRFAAEVRTLLRRTVYLDRLIAVRADTHDGNRSGTRARQGTRSSRTRTTRVVERTERVVERTERVVERTDHGTDRWAESARRCENVVDAGEDVPARGVESRSHSASSGEAVLSDDLLGSEPGDVASRPLDERLTRYLALPDERVDRALPEWHRTTETRPDAAHVDCLPHLLDSMSAVSPRIATGL